MPEPTTALVGGSVASGLLGASSANKAASAQQDAADKATDLQREMYYNNIDLQKPWYNAGTSALDAYMYELGLGPMPGSTPQIITNTTTAAAPAASGGYSSSSGHPLLDMMTGGGTNTLGAIARNKGLYGTPTAGTGGATTYTVGGQTYNTLAEAQQAAQAASGYEYGGFTETPGYQYNLDQSEQAINRNAAARGMRLSGATLESLQGNAQGLANQEYNNYLNRLAGMSGVGQGAADTTASYGTNYANAAGQNYLQSGAARASGYAGVNSALQGTMNNLGTIGMLGSMGYL